jgi:hypothetical protein
VSCHWLSGRYIRVIALLLLNKRTDTMRKYWHIALVAISSLQLAHGSERLCVVAGNYQGSYSGADEGRLTLAQGQWARPITLGGVPSIARGNWELTRLRTAAGCGAESN